MPGEAIPTFRNAFGLASNATIAGSLRLVATEWLSVDALEVGLLQTNGVRVKYDGEHARKEKGKTGSPSQRNAEQHQEPAQDLWIGSTGRFRP